MSGPSTLLCDTPVSMRNSSEEAEFTNTAAFLFVRYEKCDVFRKSHVLQLFYGVHVKAFSEVNMN